MGGSNHQLAPVGCIFLKKMLQAKKPPADQDGPKDSVPPCSQQSLFLQSHHLGRMKLLNFGGLHPRNLT